MWYAIEYAYGSHLVNNGNRADKLYEFSRRALRDAWVAAGEPNTTAPGYREVVTSRHPVVRKALQGAHDGDTAAWAVLAQQRVAQSAALTQHKYILAVYDWNSPDHLKWVATAPERKIVSWAKDVEAQQVEA